MKWKFIIWVIVGFTFNTHLHAYWSETHQQFAEDTYKGSNDLSTIEGSEPITDYYANRLGFPLDQSYLFNNVDKLDPLGFVTWTATDTPMSGTKIFIQGADDEDLPTVRATNHFFDPAHNQSLGQSISERGEYIYQFDDLSAGISSWMMEAIKAPDWALEDTGEAPNYQLTDAVTGDTATYSRQVHSLRDSYDYLYKALTSTDLETRNKKMGAHIYALGHVIHLLTDMGQPEHVRNDVHLASLYEDLTEKVVKGEINDPNYNGDFLSSFIDGGAVKYHVQRNSFTKARDYFHTTNNGSGIGLAEFTNRNFVSPTTNFVQDSPTDTNITSKWYTLPAVHSSNPENIISLYGGISNVPEDLAGNPLTGELQFVSSIIDDRQRDGNEINYRTSSHSIFNAEVNMYHNECYYDAGDFPELFINNDCKRYTLNKWNYQSYRKLLAPRIVAYGASFLKHLARGTMDVQRPDQSNLNKLLIDTPTGHIAQLPLSLKNTTKYANSDNPEPMGAGKLVAVVTFADASNIITDAYVSEEVTISSPLPKDIYTQHAFRFVKKDSEGNVLIDDNNNPIAAPFPLALAGKTPFIQVVFRGKLGDEKDIIVVARKLLYDIIKPIEVHIAPPDSGVYALVDHKAGGFTSIKAKLSSDAPLDGSVFAAAMHHNNDCYSSDLKGEYNVGGQARVCASNKYRSTAAFSTVSAAVAASNITAMPTEVGISFPDTSPVPFSATDLGLSILHYSTDGAAPIGVSFTDISEPTYISVINNTDHYAYDGDYYLVDAIPKDSNLGVFIEDRKFYPTPLNVEFKMNGAPALTITGLPAGGYSRFALLTTPPAPVVPSFIFSLEATSPNFRASLSSGLNGVISQFDSATNQIRRSYLPTIRGVISHYPIYLEQGDVGGKPDDLSLLPAIDAANQKEITLVQP